MLRSVSALEFPIKGGEVLLRGVLQQPGQCSKDGLRSILDLFSFGPIEMMPDNTIQGPCYPSQFVFVLLCPLWQRRVRAIQFQNFVQGLSLPRRSYIGQSPTIEWKQSQCLHSPPGGFWLVVLIADPWGASVYLSPRTTLEVDQRVPIVKDHPVLDGMCRRQTRTPPLSVMVFPQETAMPRRPGHGMRK